jgi:hypothetical protein
MPTDHLPPDPVPLDPTPAYRKGDVVEVVRHGVIVVVDPHDPARYGIAHPGMSGADAYFRTDDDSVRHRLVTAAGQPPLTDTSTDSTGATLPPGVTVDRYTVTGPPTQRAPAPRHPTRPHRALPGPLPARPARCLADPQGLPRRPARLELRPR